MSASCLELLQAAIAGRLESLEEFSTIPIFTIRPRSAAEALQIQDMINQALMGLTQKAGKNGAAIMVQMPTVDVTEANIPGPQMEVTVQIRVMENPMVNMIADTGTLRSAEQIGLDVLSGLHHFDPALSGSPLFADKRAMEPNNDFPGKVAYDINARTRLGIAPRAKVSPVSIAKTGALPAVTVTLACATAGAEIRYTLDGSFPGKTATLYSTPFTQDTAATIRAAAYLAGIQGSDVNETTL